MPYQVLACHEPHATRRRGLLGALSALLLAPSCTGTLDPALEPTATSPTGSRLGPGEVCEPPDPSDVQVRVEPSFVVLPPCPAGAIECVTRQVNVVVDPDFCGSAAQCSACSPGCLQNPPQDCPDTCSVSCNNRAPVTFESSDPSVVAAPEKDSFELHRAKIPLTIKGGNVGSATISVKVDAGDGTIAEATLTVDVLSPELATCQHGDGDAGTLAPGGRVPAEPLGGGLAGAAISLPENADTPNHNAFLWSVKAFDASVGCGGNLVSNDAMPGYVALGPAVTFGEADFANTGRAFKRELPMSIPLNPARMPLKARWRHLRVAFSSPDFPDPRVVPVADPRVQKDDNGAWVLTFKAPRLGTYQAVVQSSAGTQSRKRRLTHRAVIGVSMGGGGTAMFGMRHHHLFDVLAPLGGPVDWTWLLHHIENNHLAGFRPILPGTQLADIQLERAACTSDTQCQADETCIGVPTDGKCTLMPVAPDPYAHPSTFNTWWNESPRTGTGGRFPRDEYAQIFRDLALMFGNPNGENLTPGAENLPAGVRPDDPSQLGDHRNGECAIWVDPLEGHPDEEHQNEIKSTCPAERCAHTLTLNGYYDDEYNPDGTFPVITVCDGSPQDDSLTPYANTWKPGDNNYPLELALAVDYNGNGKRDELEPIIRSGHERWDDWGEDGIASVDEPGYDPVTNRDPTGDDYHPQYNPSGTEGDHRYQEGEPFDDYGLDGVPGTAQQPANGWQKPGDGYDVGEGDGKFTVTRGLQRFWDVDAHSIVRQTTSSVPGGDLDDGALSRIDLWTDGGTRDIFNFSVDAQHLVGTFAARGRDVTYFTGLSEPIGLDPAAGVNLVPSRIVYEDLQGIVLQRYGAIDPTDQDEEKGSGQHVGTANEIAARLQTALYFIGSRWPEQELRQLVRDSADKPAPAYDNGERDPCEVSGSCEFEFTSSFGRTGPVAVTLPPGYAHADQQDRRYPVIYLLHGYGQTPEDLAPAIVFLSNWMNGKLDGVESRLPKAILVYVDGRCRVREQDGKAECIRGTFYTDSVRPDGAQDESWWLELMDHVDQKYRTMPATEVEWTE